MEWMVRLFSVTYGFPDYSRYICKREKAIMYKTQIE